MHNLKQWKITDVVIEQSYLMSIIDFPQRGYVSYSSFLTSHFFRNVLKEFIHFLLFIEIEI